MENNKEDKKEIKINFIGFIIIFIIILLILGGIIYYIYDVYEKNNSDNDNTIKTIETNNETDIANEIEIENDLLFENNSNTEENIIYEETNLDIGKYDINETAVDPGEGSCILDVILEENNYFTIDLVYGGKYIGTYNINDNYLICNANSQETYEGGESIQNVESIFEFEIVNNKTIKFVNIKNSIDEFELNQGLTYSIK